MLCLISYQTPPTIVIRQNQSKIAVISFLSKIFAKMNDWISLITIYLGLPLMSNTSHQDAKCRRDTLLIVNLQGIPKKINSKFLHNKSSFYCLKLCRDVKILDLRVIETIPDTSLVGQGAMIVR